MRGLSGFPDEQGLRELKIVEYSFILKDEIVKCGNDCALFEFLDVIDLRSCIRA